MRCEHCGSELVEVDNPMRREFRHRRGVVCPGPASGMPRPTAEGADDLPCICDCGHCGDCDDCTHDHPEESS